MDQNADESEKSYQPLYDSQPLPVLRRLTFMSSSSEDDSQETSGRQNVVTAQKGDFANQNKEDLTQSIAVGISKTLSQTNSEIVGNASSSGSIHKQQEITATRLVGRFSPELLSRPGLSNVEVTTIICDICLRCGTYKNKVSKLSKSQIDDLRTAAVLDRQSGIEKKPFDDVYRARNPSLSESLSVVVQCCEFCVLHYQRLLQEQRRLNGLLKAGKSNVRRVEKKIESLTRKINNRRYGSTKERSKTCFLSGISSVPCDESNNKFFRPTLLLSRSPDVLEVWKGLFATACGISGVSTSEIASSCRDIHLCSSHRTKLKNTLSRA